ncbi:molybdenum ABC transporter ATP-binding protein [Thalassotalea sp. SU-HH00458]|uniref:molybdenum ABC transporter ATP-binding protein n=1 Tax=Thalassotalea sp. SU-HH00458 TaxID=3127657 RepID=UPI003108625E
MKNRLTLNLESTKGPFSLVIQQCLSFSGIVGVFGHSGSGKTSLLRAIAGLDKHVKGKISFNDRMLLDTKNKQNINAENRHISMVFQEPRLFPHLTVSENLEFAIKRCQHSKLTKQEIIELTNLSTLLNKKVTELSGGEQQKVALARAILSEPALLLLDEPLSALDRHSKKELLILLKTVNKKLNLPMVYVSHSSEELQQLAEQLIVIERGKIINSGEVHQVLHQLNSTQLIKQQTSLSVKVAEINNQHGLVKLAFDDQFIFMMIDHLTEKDKLALTQLNSLRCYIFASDISIATIEPTSSSIVNQLYGKITKISQVESQVLLTLTCQQQTFFANISSYSLDKLSLSINQAVYIQFKASAVRTLTI